MSTVPQHLDLFPEPDIVEDTLRSTDTDSEESTSGFDSESDPEPDPFDHAGRAVRDANEPCYDEAQPNNASQNESALCAAVKAILTCIKSQIVGGKRMTLGSFLEALSWGDADCTADPTVRGHRQGFLSGEEFARLLRVWWKPPRSKRSHRSRPAGGRPVLQKFLVEMILEVISEELEQLDPILRASEGPLTKSELLGVALEELQEQMRTLAPTLWAILDYASYSEQQRKVNKCKDPSNRVMLMVASILYSRTHHCNRLQRALAIYFKFKGLSAKGCDTLHALGVTMSSKWTTDAVSNLSKESMDEVVYIKDHHPVVLSHDNLQMSFRVFSQRLDADAEFGSGTAATVYVKKNAPAKDLSLNRALQMTRAQGIRTTITSLDIFDFALDTYPSIERHMEHHVLSVLLDSAEFDRSTYAHKSSHFLDPPAPVTLLPCGEEHVTHQYMLGTLPIPEASYEDNDKVIAELLKQLGVRSDEEKRRLATEDIIYWVGDQLTVDRIRGLQRFCCQEDNSYERLDFIIPIFGWLHLQMAYAKSIHKQYLATPSAIGLLSHAFATLERKGLDKPSTKGPFHDNLERALYHVLSAHVRACWLSLPGVDSLSDLRQRDAIQLRQLAVQIVAEHASAPAIKKLTPKGEYRGDLGRQQAVMFMKDTLAYVVLDGAIRRGDVGLMEGFLPHLAIRFAGGKNSHYVTECLELMQALRNEWPEGVKSFIRENCWLVNSTGKRDGHTPIDRAQEARIKDIKVTHRSQGPSINWEYLRKLHPALPVIQELSHHVEHEFRTWTRYSRHTDPGDTKGILRLQEAYISEGLHKTRHNRVFNEIDRVKDFYNAASGVQALESAIGRWAKRHTVERSTREDWRPLPEEEDVGQISETDTSEGSNGDV